MSTAMNLKLVRDEPRADCTRGTLTAGDVVVQTIERPWVPSPQSHGGVKGVSCVPPGIYRLVRHDTEAHPKTWALVNPGLDVFHYEEDVPSGRIARTTVLLHPANRASELRGCIAPGLRRASWRGTPVVEQSVIAMERIKRAVAWVDGNTLEIL